MLAGEKERAAAARPIWRELPHRERIAEQVEFARDVLGAYPGWALAMATLNAVCNTLETHWIQALHFYRETLHCDLMRWRALPVSMKAFHAAWAFLHAAVTLAAVFGLFRLLRERQWALLAFLFLFAMPFVYGATTAQGARFRLYLEGLLLMLALFGFGRCVLRRSRDAG
jgi:hypothetical protein